MKTRVLIVDDEPIARRGIRRYLAEHNGIEVVGEAANGISAVEQINQLRPDIVFLDVQMPDLDGFGVIENVEKENPLLVLHHKAFQRADTAEGLEQWFETSICFPALFEDLACV
ncbi:MAG: response regulator, partial [Candidatus Korobacteraceae bacterium]